MGNSPAILRFVPIELLNEQKTECAKIQTTRPHALSRSRNIRVVRSTASSHSQSRAALGESSQLFQGGATSRASESPDTLPTQTRIHSLFTSSSLSHCCRPCKPLPEHQNKIMSSVTTRNRTPDLQVHSAQSHNCGLTVATHPSHARQRATSGLPGKVCPAARSEAR